MPIIEQRGHFWWNDKRIPDGCAYPDDGVPGLLKVDDDGNIRLELDGCMPSDKHPMVNFFERHRTPVEKNIQGILKVENQRVLLTPALPRGGRLSSNGISFEVYIALNCMISSTPFPPDKSKPATFRTIKVDLRGFESWLWLTAIDVKSTRSGLTAKYKNPSKIVYSLPRGTLAIEYELKGPYWDARNQREFKLEQIAHCRISSKESLTLEECQERYRFLEETLILLSDSEHRLDWPSLTSSDGKRRCIVYFPRGEGKESPPAAHECHVTFPKIRKEFGTLYARYSDLRKSFGPGFYLYFGTRRGMKMFVEHRFANLIWGLEALHRRGGVPIAPGKRLREKVNRILDQITDESDKDWLDGRLKYTLEPALKDRLFAIFEALPLPWNKRALIQFCEECAASRNDVSHLGGKRDGGDYTTFMLDLNRKSSALAALYHLAILREIGLSPDLLDVRKNPNASSTQMLIYLNEVGVLKTNSDSAN